MGKLTNERTRKKVTQSKEFQDFDKFSLQDCFRAALEHEGIGMMSEAVNMTATTMPKIMAIHDEQNEAEYVHQQQINEITSSDDNGRAKNNNCWKCGGTGHFCQRMSSKHLWITIHLNLIQWLQTLKFIFPGLYPLDKI